MTLTEVAALFGLGDRARVGVASHDATPIRLETPIPSPRTSVLPAFEHRGIVAGSIRRVAARAAERLIARG
jgi:hypothetical protein